MAAKERELLMELENINRLDVKSHELFLNKNVKILHENHAFMLKVSLLLILEVYMFASCLLK